MGEVLEAKSNNRPLVMLAACMSIAYLLPYHVHPFRAFYNEWIAILGVAILLAFHSEQKTPVIRMPWTAFIPVGLVVFILLQTLLGMLTVSWDAILPVAYFAAAAVAIVLGASMSGEMRGAQRLCFALAAAHLIAGLLSVGIATLQFVGAEGPYGSLMTQMPPRAHNVRPFANVAQPNQLALLFCMSIAAVWWFFQSGRLRAVIAFASSLFLLWGLALTQSRIGWLIVPSFAAVIYFLQGRSGFKRMSAMIVGLHVLLYVVLVFSLPYIASTVGLDNESATERVQTSSDRLVYIQQALHVSLAHPLSGAGWYEFGPRQVDIGLNFDRSGYTQHAHNILLNFAAEMGWPVTLMVFGVLAYWFVSVCLRRQMSKENGFAILFLVAVLIHSMVEFPLWYAYVLMPVALLIGMVHQEHFGAKQIGLARHYMIAACVIMFAALVIIATDYRRVVVGFRALGWQSLGLKADEGTTEKPGLTVFPHFYEYFWFAQTSARKGMTAEEITRMEKIARRFGYAPVLMRMSLVYALNGRPDDAVKAMITIERLHPNDYGEAYQAWENFANIDPGTYAEILGRLPGPDPKPKRRLSQVRGEKT